MNEYAVYDISNKVLKWGLSLYEWGAVIFVTVIGIAIFNKGIIEVIYCLLFGAGLIAFLKFYKIGKPDGFVKSYIDYFWQIKDYHVPYKPERRSAHVRYKL
ncbi:MAG: hypothetical protein ACYCTB_10920 [bacterium]